MIRFGARIHPQQVVGAEPLSAIVAVAVVVAAATAGAPLPPPPPSLAGSQPQPLLLEVRGSSAKAWVDIPVLSAYVHDGLFCNALYLDSMLMYMLVLSHVIVVIKQVIYQGRF
jgi:hypothetical protein